MIPSHPDVSESIVFCRNYIQDLFAVWHCFFKLKDKSQNVTSKHNQLFSFSRFRPSVTLSFQWTPTRTKLLTSIGKQISITVLISARVLDVYHPGQDESVFSTAQMLFTRPIHLSLSQGEERKKNIKTGKLTSC